MRTRVSATISACLLLSLILVALSCGSPPQQPEPGSAPANSFCPPLPMTGNPVHVSSVSELESAVNNATPGDTILIADGTYQLDGVSLWVDVPDVTLRSASGNREAVTLDGNYITAEIVQIATSNVTIADLTLREAYDHPIHVMSSDGANTENTLIYNVHIVDPGQQAIKVNPAAAGFYPDHGEIACSHIELTDAGRPHIRDECYTGGVDAHQAWGWIIRDNLIEGFWCTTGLSEHAVHMWRGCRDTVVERNVLRNNARGVGFGLAENDGGRTYPDNPCPGAGGGYVDHYGGIIRNNSIFVNDSRIFASPDGFDCGVCLWQACGAWAVHNTVASTQAPAASSIEWRFDHTDVDIVNNLLTHNLWDRGGTARLAGNLEYQPLSLFVDGAGGDLHLLPSATAAIDQGVAIAAGLCDDDIDGDARPSGSGRDVGADEYTVPAPAAVADLRVVQAVTATGMLTVTLGWTAPAEAVTYTLRYASVLVTEGNWNSAIDIPVPFTASPPGSAESLTAPVPYAGGTVYFALKSQNAAGNWSGLSNNAFWPSFDIFLPLLARA